MPYRILHLIETKGPGGAETVFLRLIQGMRERGYEVYASITGPGWVKDQIEKLDIEPLVFPTNGSFDVKFLKRMINFVRTAKIDIIHSHLLGANLYSSMTGIITGKKVISTFHGTVDFDDNKQGRLFWLKGKIIEKGSDFIVAVSNDLKKKMAANNWIPQERIHVIFNGIDTSKYKTDTKESAKDSLGFTKEDILIGKIGNIRRTKGHEYFLRAAAIVHNRFPSAKFLIVGHASDNDRERLQGLAKTLGIQNVVIFMGFKEDIQKILSSLDVFGLASTSEGFSLVTVEAMAAGIPVVCTKSGGPEEIVIHEKNGLLVPPTDPESLASAICRVISDKRLAIRLTQEGLKSAESFSLNSMLNNYEALYSKCLGKTT